MAGVRLRVLNDIWAAEPAVFESPMTSEDAVQSLAAIVERRVWGNWGVDCLMGRVTSQRVWVWHHRIDPGWRMPTTFYGPFSRSNNQRA